MRLFVDTSFLYALMAEADKSHVQAARLLQVVAPQAPDLVTTNYVVVECSSLLQRRIGLPLAKRLVEYVNGCLSVIWVDQASHGDAERLWQREGRRDLSFVDCVSFSVMREQGIEKVLTFDRDFREAGFQVLEPPPDLEVRERRARYHSSRRKPA